MLTRSGRPTVAELARKGARVYMAARSRARADEAIEAIKKDIPDADIVFLECDLSDLSKVKRAAEEFLRFVPRVNPNPKYPPWLG